MTISRIRTEYSRHVLRCTISGIAPLSITRFARLAGYLA